MTTNDNMVFRALAEPLEQGGDGLTLSGYAAVFNQRAHIVDHLGEYDEIIRPGAFKRSINAKTPFLLYQHGRHPVFGQFPLGTIETLREDERGLYVEARLVDSPFLEPIRSAIRDRALTGMSVAMESPRGKATWSNEDGVKLRTVNEAKLYELGPVLGEAYADTTVQIRSAITALQAFDPDARIERATIEEVRPMSTYADRQRIVQGRRAEARAQRVHQIERERQARQPVNRDERMAYLRFRGLRTPEERALAEIWRLGAASRRGVIVPDQRTPAEIFRAGA